MAHKALSISYGNKTKTERRVSVCLPYIFSVRYGFVSFLFETDKREQKKTVSFISLFFQFSTFTWKILISVDKPQMHNCIVIMRVVNLFRQNRKSVWLKTDDFPPRNTWRTLVIAKVF